MTQVCGMMISLFINPIFIFAKTHVYLHKPSTTNRIQSNLQIFFTEQTEVQEDMEKA